MTRFWLQSALLLSALWGALVLFIRAQPYDDSALRAFLTPAPGCAVPCFMDIRPGVTTMGEVLGLLRGHQWVGRLTTGLNHRVGQVTSVTWEWTEAASPFVHHNGYVHSNDGYTIDFLSLPLTVRLWQIWLIYGHPDLFAITAVGDHPTLFYVTYYRQHRLWISGADLACPFNPLQKSDLSLQMGAEVSLVGEYQPFTRQAFYTKIRTLGRHNC